MLHWCGAGSVAEKSIPVDRWDGTDVDQAYALTDEWHDPVTGMPRPRSFLEHLERVLARSGRRPHSVAMLLLRIGNFDVLRARVGEPRCDELLRTIAERLHEEVPEPNLVTRLCGGDFAIVLHGLGPEVTLETLATRLLERASEPCPRGDQCTVVGALILSDGRKETAMELLDRATRALTRANIRLGSQARRALGID